MFGKINENNEVITTGNLFELIKTVKRPNNLTEEQLKDLNVYNVVRDNARIEPWQYVVKSNYTFDGDNEVINETKVVEDKTIEDFREEIKKQKIKPELYRILSEGFETSKGITLDAEKDRMNDFANAVQFAEAGGATNIKIRDFYNVTHEIGITDFNQMILELGINYEKQLQTKWALEEHIDTLTDYQTINDMYWRKAVYTGDDIDAEFSHWEYNEVL